MRIPKIFFLIAVLVFIVGLIMTIQLFRGTSSKTPENNTATQQLSVVSTDLTGEPIGVTAAISIKFNNPVPNTSLQITVIPQSEITYTLGQTPNELVVYPKNAWNFDKVYTIKISQTDSLGRQLLDRDYEFKFKTLPMGGI